MSHTPSEFELVLDESAVVQTAATANQGTKASAAETPDSDSSNQVSVSKSTPAAEMQVASRPAQSTREQQGQSASRIMQAVRNELEKVLIGQSAAIEGVLCSLIASGHVRIEGVPGLGKNFIGARPREMLCRSVCTHSVYP